MKKKSPYHLCVRRWPACVLCKPTAVPIVWRIFSQILLKFRSNFEWNRSEIFEFRPIRRASKFSRKRIPRRSRRGHKPFRTSRISSAPRRPESIVGEGRLHGARQRCRPAGAERRHTPPISFCDVPRPQDQSSTPMATPRHEACPLDRSSPPLHRRNAAAT